jgi:AraC family carnitine catabolism transcriptional activator
VTVDRRYGVEDRRIVNAITLMEQNIKRPVPTKTVASLVGISPRQFERMWLKHFNVSPSQFYLELRLKTAQKLLHESTYSLLDIAMRWADSAAVKCSATGLVAPRRPFTFCLGCESRRSRPLFA